MLASLLRSFSALAVLVVSASFTLAATAQAVPSLPLNFEQNQGQVASEYPFLFRQNGTEALFLPAGVDLQFGGSRTRAGSHLGLRLLAESPGVAVRPELPLAGRTNYLLGPDQTKWVRGVPTFSRLRYTAVYPGVDLVFYGNGSRLEHDFHVAPGADAGRIAFHLDGAESLTLSSAGDLQVATGADLLVLERPNAYQEETHGRVPVAATFALAHDGTITFALGHYDHTRELVIDPALTYATYLDKLSLGVAGIATDSTGATYITGYVFQSTYGTTPGAYQTTCPACTNTAPAAFITKVDPTGTKVVYSTFLGGTGYTQPFAIAVDASGDAVIGGRTFATDYPVKNNVGSGAFSQSGSFAFITSLTPDGSALNFSSVFAGDGDSFVNSITTDSAGNAFLTGVTGSSSHPVTPGALNAGTPSFGRTYGFVTKLAPAGSLLYSAIVGSLYLPNGGGGPTGPAGIAVDSAGNAYLAGAAGSVWPTTPGAYQPTIPLSLSNTGPFVSKLAADGSHLIFSTFVGTGYATALALDPDNNVLFAGYANDNTYPLTSDATQGPTGCCAYLTRLSADGSKLLYSSFLQSDQRTANQIAFSGTQPSAIRLDATANIWIAGFTADTNLPLLHPLQSSFPPVEPGGTGFLSEFDPTGKTLKFSTFYGNISTGIDSLSIAPSGIVTIAGTTSTGIYTTPDSLISSNTPAPPGYTYNYGFLARINPAQASPALCVANSLSGPPGPQALVGTPATLSLLITSCGELPLTVSSIQSSSPFFTVGDPTAACGSSLAPGAACTVSINFLPTHSGNVSATLTLLSNASIPTATVALAATGIPLPPTFSSTSLSFSTTPGVASPTQTITVTNVSDIPLTFLNSNYTQPFTLNNTCDPQLAPGLSCSIVVGFLPATAGNFTGSLYFSFLGNFASDQTVTLTGTAAAPSVTFGPATPAAATVTVTAGQPATYTLATTSVGNFSGTATFSCTGLPQYAACSFAPSTLTLTAGASTPVSLTITTGPTTTTALQPSQPGSRTSSGGLLALAALGLPLLWISRRQASRLARASLLSLIVLSLSSIALLTGCGGGPSSSGPSPSQPTAAVTPAGTYTVNVVATTSTAAVSTPVTLVVK